MTRLKLFPETSRNAKHSLAVDAIHSLYIEEYGNPQGLPVVFLHGGPGSGCESYHSRFFDPEKYRIVLFDQRGCGKSTPHAELEGNTTQHLVADIERLREHLQIDRWVVFGGSWGSTLGLAYAEAHPQRVLGLVLRGIFLCRDGDIQWFYQYGASQIFPDYWRDYIAPVAEADRGDMVSAFYKLLTSKDRAQQLNAAKAWSVWEGRTATLLSNPHVVAHFADPQVALSLARIECHYFVNNCFLEPDELVRKAHRLHDIPGYIVHGRYDVVCPIDQAFALHEAWPQAKFIVVPDAGHSATEPGTVHELVTATNELAARYT